jgi:predicted dehydrogenase
MGEPVSTRGVGVGIVGVGTIAAQYLATFARLPEVRLVAVADLDTARAETVAREQGVRALSVPELLRDPEVELVVNLTVPAAHAAVALDAIAAGKAVYGEKPLAATVAEARRVVTAAREAGVRLGCAPDTVLGTGLQTARAALDAGRIGTPIAAAATMVTPGHERWHPQPDFYYRPGGGPLLDMGPYYVTALVHLLGPVEAVVGMASHLRSERTIGSGPRAGEVVPVDVDTHVTGVLRHASGALTTLTTSFDAVATGAPAIEVHGTLGSLAVPDPNDFAGPVRLRTLDDADWQELPVSAGRRDAARGTGVADLVTARPGRTPRASGDLALHVLDVMESLLTATRTGGTVPVTSVAVRPDPVPLG